MVICYQERNEFIAQNRLIVSLPIPRVFPDFSYLRIFMSPINASLTLSTSITFFSRFNLVIFRNFAKLICTRTQPVIQKISKESSAHLTSIFSNLLI